MKLIITLDTDNAAFEGDPNAEVARILRALAERLDLNPYLSPGYGFPLLDENGNEAGYFQVSDDPNRPMTADEAWHAMTGE